MAEIRVSSSQLKSEAEALLDLASRLKSAITALENDEANLNGMWEGEANTAFHNAFISDKDQMNAFNELVIKFATTLTQIAAKYESAESKNVDIANTRSYR